MDDILDLERAVLDLTARRDALAAEVRRLQERADAVRAELTKAKELTRRGGIPVATLVGLQLAVLCLDGEA